MSDLSVRQEPRLEPESAIFAARVRVVCRPIPDVSRIGGSEHGPFLVIHWLEPFHGQYMPPVVSWIDILDGNLGGSLPRKFFRSHSQYMVTILYLLSIFKTLKNSTKFGLLT